MNAAASESTRMAEFLSGLPRAMSSYYWSNATNPTIRLGTVLANLKAGAFTQDLRAVVSLACQPSPRLVYEALEPINTELFFALFEHGETVTLPRLPEVPDRPRLIHFSSDRFIGRLPRVELGSGLGLDRIRFVVFNCPDIYGLPIRNGKAVRASRVALSSDRWSVTMDGAANLHNRLQQTRVRGAYLVTHAGELRTIDGSTFSADEAQEVLAALYYMMSFACGARTGPALPIGYARGQRKPSWAHWAVRAIDPYQGAFAWFDSHHQESLGAIFGTFLTKWADSRSRAVLQRVISGFVQAHDPDPIENAIVVIQIALETLTWHIRSGKPAWPGAGGRIAKLLSESDIPLEIPVEMPSLISAAAGRGWVNGPHAIVEIRNDIVHVGRAEVVNFETLADAWRLSLWYLELVLLHWLGYVGVYNRRTGNNRAVGKVEPVPWGPPTLPR